jgi:hypothetical protein
MRAKIESQLKRSTGNQQTTKSEGFMITNERENRETYLIIVWQNDETDHRY